MIGMLKGQIEDKKGTSLVIMVSGVGYLVQVPIKTATQIKINQTLKLFIHTVVREDELSLYGFITQAELNLFEMLLGVPGIGPKTALTIVDRGVNNIEEAITQARIADFRRKDRKSIKTHSHR